MRFTPGEIETKEFVVSLRGYDTNEVAGFLRALADDVRALEQQLNEALARPQVDNDLADVGEQVAQVLISARASADGIRTQAEREAADIRLAAERAGRDDAQRSIDEARSFAEELVAEASERAALMEGRGREVLEQSHQLAKEMFDRARGRLAEIYAIERATREAIQFLRSELAELHDRSEAVAADLEREADLLGAAPAAVMEPPADGAPPRPEPEEDEGSPTDPDPTAADPTRDAPTRDENDMGVTYTSSLRQSRRSWPS